jgi:ferredoxin-NADP reductase
MTGTLDRPEPEARASTVQESRRVVVDALTPVADGVLALELRAADGRDLPEWEAGAHVDVVLAENLVRQYSLCGNPDDRPHWRLAVLEERDSRGGSRHVHSRLRVGDVLEVRGPRNNFALVEAPAYLFIAGGIGITPVLPLVAAASRTGRPFAVVYGGRSRSGMAFTDELARYGDRVTLVPQDELGLIDLDAALDACAPATAVYCCGPEPLLTAVTERCAARPDVTLHRERFSPTGDRAPTADDSGFDVELASSGQLVAVAPQETLLEALERVGVDVPNSCREGICGTCETTVLAGTPDHRDSLLSPDERSSGTTMLVCVSRSCGPRLVLDL